MKSFLLFIVPINCAIAQIDIGARIDTPATNSSDRLSVNILKNISYYGIDMFDTVEMENGYAELPVDSSINDGTYYLRYDDEDWGDLDNDGQEDAIVTLAERIGGSGVFVCLVPVLNRNGNAIPLRPFELGDRVVVVDITIDNSIANVTALFHAEGEPLASAGSNKRILRLELKGESLQEIK